MQTFTFDQLRELIESHGISCDQLRVMLLGNEDDVATVVHEIIASYDVQDAAHRIAMAVKLLSSVLVQLVGRANDLGDDDDDCYW